MFEHVLELGSRLRTSGMKSPICFASSNTKDYGVPGHTHAASIEAELAAVSASFVTNLAWAASIVGFSR